MKEVLFFVGNGFNHYLLSVLKKNQLLNDKELDQIHNIINLWNKFDDYFKEVKDYFINLDSKLTDEDVLHQIYESLYLLELLNKSTILKVETCKDCVDKTKNIIQKTIFEMLFNIMKEYVDNVDITFKLNKIVKDHQDNFEILKEIKFSVLTTNYDNLVDEFFNIKNNNLEDGFRKNNCVYSNKDSFNHLCFQSENFIKGKYKIIHLHGNFMFFERKNQSIKIRRNELDSEKIEKLLKNGFHPNVVFNLPKLKQKIINESHVLSRYFKYLENLESDDLYIFIIGLSLNSDPHINENLVRILEKRFNNNKKLKIGIFDKSPQNIVDKILSSSTIEDKLRLELESNLYFSDKDGLFLSLKEFLDNN